MKKKECPECGEKSYSATSNGNWDCPNCGADLSDEEAIPVGEKEKNEEGEEPEGDR